MRRHQVRRRLERAEDDGQARLESLDRADGHAFVARGQQVAIGPRQQRAHVGHLPGKPDARARVLAHLGAQAPLKGRIFGPRAAEREDVVRRQMIHEACGQRIVFLVSRAAGDHEVPLGRRGGRVRHVPEIGAVGQDPKPVPPQRTGTERPAQSRLHPRRQNHQVQGRAAPHQPPLDPKREERRQPPVARIEGQAMIAEHHPRRWGQAQQAQRQGQPHQQGGQPGVKPDHVPPPAAQHADQSAPAPPQRERAHPAAQPRHLDLARIAGRRIVAPRVAVMHQRQPRMARQRRAQLQDVPRHARPAAIPADQQHLGQAVRPFQAAPPPRTRPSPRRTADRGGRRGP